MICPPRQTTKMASTNKQEKCQLSQNDAQVLQSIFNPNLPYGDVEEECPVEEPEGKWRCDIQK